MFNDVNNKNNKFIFANKSVEDNNFLDIWKILVVDDEKEVHTITGMVLDDVVFNDKGINMLHAYSGEEAKKIIKENPDTALILLDIVMEEDDAGLKVIKYIREELKNTMVRIVIRTGQPGQAPEKKVIVDYDINDYKEKAELTSDKLFSTVIASLRSYDNLEKLEKNRNGLKKIIEAASVLNNLQIINKFADISMNFLSTLISSNINTPLNKISGFIITILNGKYFFLSATGKFENFFKNIETQIKDKEILNILKKVEKYGDNINFGNNWGVYKFKDYKEKDKIIYIERKKKFSESEQNLFAVLGSAIISAYNNICMTDEIEKTQKEISFTLGEVVEKRSQETSFHVKRVAEYSKLLALKYGLDEDTAELIKKASPLHDVGKVGIPDQILNKKDKLTAEEFEIIKTHTTLGHSLFKNSHRKILKTAAIIALQHHERFNGKGYPNALKGDNIHIFGRITCLADIFDAIGSDRIYKKAWELDKILGYIKEERGKIFDPELVDIFFKNLDEILKIRDELKEI